MIWTRFILGAITGQKTVTKHISHQRQKSRRSIYYHFSLMHVLLLEDTIDIGEAIRDYLQAMHYSVGRAKTLQESYTLLRKQHFDVAVIDRMLPDGDGLQACRDIKEYKSIPVIMTTARGQLEDKVQ